MDPLNAEIRAQVIVLAKTSPKLVQDDTHLIAELGMSSMDLLGLLAFVEERFQISIPDRELAALVTVRKIVAKIRELTDGRQRGAA